MGRTCLTVALVVASGVLPRAGYAEAATVAALDLPNVEVAPAQKMPGKYVGFETLATTDGKGGVVVAAIDMGTNQILVWTSSDGGKTFGLPRPALQPADTRRAQGDPWLQTLGPGRFLLSLMAKRSAKEPGIDVYLLRSDDGGQAWKLIRVFSGGTTDVDRPVCAVSPDGRHAAIAFVGGADGDGGPSQVWFSSDGGATWTPAPAPLSRPKSGSLPTAIVIDDAGRTVIGYRVSADDYRLRLGVTEDGGRSWKRHELGRITDKLGQTPHEVAAGVTPDFAPVALAQSGAGRVHALSVQRAGKDDRLGIWHRWSKDGKTWSEPVELSKNPTAEVKSNPVIAAHGQRLHAAWVESEGGWCHVWYRGSLDGGYTWSDRVEVSKADRPTDLLTDKGFRSFSGHYMGITEDGVGTAHIVWAVTQPDRIQLVGEVWHSTLRLK